MVSLPRSTASSCFVSAVALPKGRRCLPGQGLAVPVAQLPGVVRGREWDLSGLQAIHPVPLLRSSTPVEPTYPRHRGHVDAAPALRTAKASALADFGADWRSFSTCCPTLRVSRCRSHARLASGWPARPLPGGSRTRWTAARGFSSCPRPSPSPALLTLAQCATLIAPYGLRTLHRVLAVLIIAASTACRRPTQFLTRDTASTCLRSMNGSIRGACLAAAW